MATCQWYMGCGHQKSMTLTPGPLHVYMYIVYCSLNLGTYTMFKVTNKKYIFTFISYNPTNLYFERGFIVISWT